MTANTDNTKETQAVQAKATRARPATISAWQIALVVLVVVQLALAWQTPLWLVHRYRVPYEIVKD